jgi:eukaryotic-like serine/threonine-protein kinase
MRTVNVIEAIYFAALEKRIPTERVAYLDEACKADDVLRRCVERMLAAEPKIGNFLQPDRPASFEPPAIEERPGSVIGPYKLLQELGEGGFGVVFMAEQEQPVRRKVALKSSLASRPSGKRWRSWIIPTSRVCWMAARPRPAGPTS